MKLLYEGKAKIIWEESRDQIIQEFKDSFTAFNGVKKECIEGKGAINNTISSHLFQLLNKQNIFNHFLEKLSDTKMLCQKVSIIPLEVVVRNYAAGSFSKRYGINDGRRVEIIELFLKNDELGDPIITEEIAQLLEITTISKIKHMKMLANQANTVLENLFYDIGFKLIDIKFEFGINSEGFLLLADELSPDNMRLIDIETNESYDKDRFRLNLGSILEHYKIVQERLKNV